jgi:hypothetical protein
MRLQFETLREKLLRAGIAPRHVRRYLGELDNHLEDLANEERAKGRSRDDAEAVARARLGADDALAAALLARPGLRSVTARYPWAVFALGPIALSFIVLMAAVFVEVGFFNLLTALTGGPREGPDPAWLKVITWIWNTLFTYAAPFVIAWLMFVVGQRQRVAGLWLLVGIAVACIAGGFHWVEVTWHDQGGGELSVGFEQPYSHGMLITAGLRAAINLLLVGGAYWFWQRRPFVAAAHAA